MSSKWLASARTLSSSEGTEFNDEDLEDLECVKPGGELGPGRSWMGCSYIIIFATYTWPTERQMIVRGVKARFAF